MNKISISIACLCVLTLMPVDAFSQQPATGGGLQFPPDQKLMFEAANKVVKHDYKSAEDIYTQAISINPNNIDAYLQRGIVRRELGNAEGTAADGKMAVTLANTSLKN